MFFQPQQNLTQPENGHIQCLHLMYQNEYRPFNHILDTFVEGYLNESLLKIRVENVGRQSIAKTTKPFENVSTLRCIFAY